MILLFSCSGTMQSSESVKSELSDAEISEDEIILISRYINYADGYYNRGTFIGSDGEVYSFDFSDQKDTFKSDEPDAQFIEKLKTIKKNQKPCMHLDADTIQQIYYYSGKINKNAEFKGKYEACDAGEEQLYICDNENNEFVLCSEEGDYCGKLEDSYAGKLINFFDESLKKDIHDAISAGSD